MQKQPVVAFLNPPFWALEPIPNNPTEKYIRRGIRAGSRWPMTMASNFIPDHFQLGSYVPAPIFMQSAAAWVQRHCPEATVILRDSIARGESYQTFDEWWQTAGVTHVILEVGASSWEHDLRYIKAMKRSVPTLRLAVAGPPARDFSKQNHPEVDAWLLGEYEKNAVKFVNGQSGVIGFDMLTRDELKTAPFPIFDEDCALNYFDSNPLGQAWPHLQLWSSRGCSYKCCFCAWPGTMTSDDPNGDLPRSVRFYDYTWLYDFISYRMANAAARGTPIKSIYFDDDCFNLSDRHVLSVCNVMRRIKLPWTAMCRIDTIKRETWESMKESGCVGVKVGFESGSQRVNDEIVHKKLDISDGEKTARWLRSIGLSIHSTWTIGLPGELSHERQQTLNLIKHFSDTGVHDTYQLSGTAEIAGTPLANTKHDDPFYVASPDGNKKIEEMTQK